MADILDIVRVRLVELDARRQALRHYTLNKDANFEASLIDEQIFALIELRDEIQTGVFIKRKNFE